MDGLFIEVKKVSSKSKEASDGTTVRDPESRRTVKDKVHEVHTESIRVDQIRSFRKWGKTPDQEIQIDGPCTKIYMQGDGIRSKQPEMIIQESYDAFANRLSTIRANGGEK